MNPLRTWLRPFELGLCLVLLLCGSFARAEQDAAETPKLPEGGGHITPPVGQRYGCQIAGALAHTGIVEA